MCLRWIYLTTSINNYIEYYCNLWYLLRAKYHPDTLLFDVLDQSHKSTLTKRKYGGQFHSNIEVKAISRYFVFYNVL